MDPTKILWSPLSFPRGSLERNTRCRFVSFHVGLVRFLPFWNDVATIFIKSITLTISIIVSSFETSTVW